MATVVGLFHDINQVEQAQQTLSEAGYDMGRSSIVTRDPNIEALGEIDILLTVIADGDDKIGNARLIMRRSGAEDIEQRNDDEAVAAGKEADQAYNITSGGGANTSPTQQGETHEQSARLPRTSRPGQPEQFRARPQPRRLQRQRRTRRRQHQRCG